MAGDVGHAAGATKRKAVPAETTESANKRLRSTADRQVKSRTECPYMSTITRSGLNFDTEKRCSVTMKTSNIYLCLVCGDMFHGKGPKTPAHNHAMHTEHYMYADTFTGQIWCIPDMYEVVDDSLTDVQHNLSLTYSESDIDALLSTPRKVKSVVSGVKGHAEFFDAGFVGLSNIKKTQYVNAVLQALVHVDPLVRHYLRPLVYEKEVHRSALRDAFSATFKKVWNPYNFHGQVAPRGFVDLVLSEKQMPWVVQGPQWPDPQKFFHYLLTTLNEAERKVMPKPKKSKDKARKKAGAEKTVWEDTFQGRMRVTKTDYVISEGDDGVKQREAVGVSANEVPFFTLPVNLGTNPLSKTEEEKNMLPTEHLHVMLSRYNGVKERVVSTSDGKSAGYKYTITSLPKYLTLFYDRFIALPGLRTEVQRNKCLVVAPVSSLDLSEFVSDEEKARYTSCTYDLVSSIVHEGGLTEEEGGVYKSYSYNKLLKEWYEFEDVRVEKVEGASLSRTAAHVQIWVRRGRLKTEEEQADAALDVD